MCRMGLNNDIIALVCAYDLVRVCEHKQMYLTGMIVQGVLRGRVHHYRRCGCLPRETM